MNPGTLPTDSLALPFMPASLVGMITPEHFMFTSALAGLLSAVVCWIILSRGL